MDSFFKKINVGENLKKKNDLKKAIKFFDRVVLLL